MRCRLSFHKEGVHQGAQGAQGARGAWCTWYRHGVVSAVLILCVAGGRVDAQIVEPLFADPAGGPVSSAPATADPRPFLVRTRTTLLRAGVLERTLAAPATAGFTLNLFDDASFAMNVERIEDSGFGHRTWAGHIADRPLSTVTLTLRQEGDLVSGLVTDGTTVYEILGLGGGVHRIDELDMTKMPPDVDIALAPDPSEAGEAPTSPALSSPAAVSTVDVFVYYTNALKAEIGQPLVESRIAQYVAETNLAYQRSGVNGTLRLVGFGEIALADPADAESLLNTFRANPTVLSQRDASHADVMALLVNDFAPASCGIGFIGSPGNAIAAFSITRSDSSCVYTFAHEIGHNLGAQHAPEDYTAQNPPAPEPPYPAYARAYKAPNHAFRTVMAYACATPPLCGRVLNFAEPAVFEGGQPTGTPAQHNARRLNELFPLVAAYRTATLSAPQNLQASVNGLGVTLLWQPPASGTPTTYGVVAGTAPGLSNVGQASVGLNTSVSATLPAGVYYVRAYAYNNETGLSPASNEVSFSLAPAPPPGPPRNLTFSVAGSTVNLAWLPPSSGSPPSDYLLEAGTAPGLANLASGIPVAATSLSIPGVPFGRYFLRVRARSAFGVSAPSNEADITVNPTCTLPSAPQNFTVTKAGTTLTASWSPPAAGVPSAYLLQAGSSPGAANLFNGSVGLTTSVSAPVANGPYFLRLRAANACGTGPATGEVAITVP